MACCFAIPAFLACRLSRRRGVVLATLAFWLLNIANAFFFPARYPVGDAGVFLFGWLPAFCYAALCYRVAEGLRRSERLKTSDVDAAGTHASNT